MSERGAGGNDVGGGKPDQRKTKAKLSHWRPVCLPFICVMLFFTVHFGLFFKSFLVLNCLCSLVSHFNWSIFSTHSLLFSYSVTQFGKRQHIFHSTPNASPHGIVIRWIWASSREEWIRKCENWIFRSINTHTHPHTYNSGRPREPVDGDRIHSTML